MTATTDIAEIVVSNPEATSILGLIITGILWQVQSIGPKRAVFYDRIRRAAARLLNWPLKRWLSFPTLRDKTGRDDEVIATVDVGRGELLAALWTAGFRWNPVSRVKYRTLEDGRRQYALSVSHTETVNSLWQQDVHIFPSADGPGYDILGHWEPSPTDPEAHLGGEDQEAGDPERIVRDALDEAGIRY
jgi:hypothetical protein